MSKSHLLFISFAAIFGSGWLFAPLYAAQIAGPSSMIAWFLGAVMSAVIGITMAEVIVLFPQSGGLSQIAKVTHGKALALFVVLLNLLVFIILPAIEVRAVLQYLSSYSKALATSENEISPLGYLLALVLLTAITWVNIYGTRVTAALTRLVVLFKVVTPALICFSFLYALRSAGSLDHSRLVDSSTSFSTIPWTQVFQAVATSGIIFSFNGFNQATFFAGETKNPQKAIPFAILGSILISGALYLLIQYVFLMAVPAASLAQGWGKLSFVGDQGPFAGIAVILGLGWILTVIYADAVISPLGTAFAYATAAPHLLSSLAEGSLAEKYFQRLNRHGISPFSIGIALALECLAFLFLPSLKAMIALLVAAFVTCYTIAPASLLMLRKTQPTLHRPFRVQMAPLVSYLSLFFSNLMVFSCGWVAVRNLICVSSVLGMIYFLYSQKNKETRSLLRPLQGSLWFLFQLSALAALCFYNDQHPLPFLATLGGVGGISLIALIASQR